MKHAAALVLATATIGGLPGCATDDEIGGLEEVVDVEDEDAKADGATELWIKDRLEWEGRPERQTRVFRTAREFQSFFGRTAPAEIDFTQEWAVYFAAGVQSTGGYLPEVVTILRSASGRTLTVKAETAGPGEGCRVTRAIESPATLVTIRKQQAITTRFQTRHTELDVHCQAICGEAVGPQLAYGARGALLYSEADEPWVPVVFPGAGTVPLTHARLRELLRVSASTLVDDEAWTPWIEDKTAASDEADEQTMADEYRQLRDMVELHLTDLKVYDVGGNEDGDGVRPLYILGKTACGDLAGLWATIVAT